jgi:hypothetical protein
MPVKEYSTKGPVIKLPFEEVTEPGTYLSNWTGHLLRIPPEALKPGHSPVIEILGREPMIVTKLSEDPFLPVGKARLIAADFDCEVNF